ncbi:MAG: ATP-dependent zinc metalloprotease FtsH [Egibacteraceae bacterium]
MADKRKRKGKGPSDGPKNRVGLLSGLAVIILLAAWVAVLVWGRPTVSGEELLLTEYIDLVDEGQVIDAQILDFDGIVAGTYQREDGTVAPYHMRYFQSQGLRERLADLLIANRVPFSIDQQYSKTLVGNASIALPALIIVVVFIYLIVSFRSGSGLFSTSSGARKIEPEDQSVSFADVAGQDEAVAELRELSSFLSDPGRFAAVGATVPKGVLLYGPPGCGKTLLARALAGEAGASFYSISGSDFVELYVGVGASRVREMFKEARENAPAILFIDELDSVGRRRSAGGGGGSAAGSSDEQEQTLNQILAEMDGFSATEGVIVLGATNRADTLDPALLRPGRFDRAIGLERVDEAGRLQILELHAKGKPLAADVDLREIARKALGMTGADLASVVNEAALLTARTSGSAIGQAQLLTALERIIEAPERQRRLSLRDRSIGKRSTSANERVTFADVAGANDAIDELTEVRDFLAAPERFAEMGARPPRGILLAGPPGCGKTLLARAVAGEANAAFFSASGTDFVEIYVGQGAARVRDLFAEATAAAPAILFIDEIDAVGGRRTGEGGGAGEREQTLNQILVALDGFEKRSAVIVMAATNRPDMLDPALVRPGRFDRQVTVELPDREGRAAILAVHAAEKPLAADVNLDAIAGITPGFSGADLANVINEAALLATRRGEHLLTMGTLEEAIERSMLGIGSRRHALSDEHKTIVGYHEAGHALVGRAVPGGRVPHKLSIMPRGKALGFTWHSDDSDDRRMHSRASMVDEMATLLGGRVAEQLVFDDPGSGAADDLARATRIARQMICDLGMSPTLGPRSYSDLTGNGSPAHSQETARIIDAEIRAVMDEAYDRAYAILAGDRPALDRVAQALVEHETLTASQFTRLAEGSPPRRQARAAPR